MLIKMQVDARRLDIFFLERLEDDITRFNFLDDISV
jgi:hypothetical protein